MNREGSVGKNMGTHPQCWVCGAPSSPDPNVAELGYWRCPVCELTFQAARASVAEEAARYDASYFESYGGVNGGSDYDATIEQRRYEATRRIHFLRRLVTKGSLIEIGAASGHFVAAAQAQGYDAQGVEPSKAMAERARRDYGVHVKAATLDDVSRGGEMFDILCAWHVLEHLPEPLSAVKQMWSLLKPGGCLLLELPNVGSVAAQRYGATWSQLDAESHVAHYRPSTLRRLLHGAGFTDVHVDTLSSREYVRSRPVRAAYVVSDYVRFGVAGLTHPGRHELMRAVARRPA